MEEADLLKERLQAITDKRRIQEDIAKKRRQIEEEKLKFQYIKKKILRDQWLMDGLSQQSEEEQEALKIQAEDERQQIEQLQGNITRIEKEIEALETQELAISANEEVLLMRLKEVEKSAEDIIKELKAKFHPDLTHHHSSPIPDFPPCFPLAAGKAPPTCVPGSDEPKKATFAMEISVKHDKKTGKCEVVSIAPVTPETIQEEGLKVYEDGHKSVYALPSDEAQIHSAVVGEMTVSEVEELLQQAADRNVHSEVQYHRPVFSVPYRGTCSSRPSTPRTNKTLKQPPSPISCQEMISSNTEAQVKREGNHNGQKQEGHKFLNEAPGSSAMHQDSTPRVQMPGKEANQPSFNITEQSNCHNHSSPQSNIYAKTPQDLTTNSIDTTRSHPSALVQIKTTAEGMTVPIQTLYNAVGGQSPSLASNQSEEDHDVLTESPRDDNRHSSFWAGSISPLNLFSEPVTMIFMGYENVVEEDKDTQAELVTISNSDDDDDDYVDEYVGNESGTEEYLSYHPQGYKSKVFQPEVGKATVLGILDIAGDAYADCDVLGYHKPTFMHKPGNGSYM